MSGLATELVLGDRALCSFNLPSGSGKGGSSFQEELGVDEWELAAP